ncbi:DsbA family oxidoreductase [Streptomyces sp. SID4926]|nr:DsbA family oxidoreductase [Streptomyces sp. SID4926]SCD41644.1 Predicted dithiol-disulfide isomerase, DsbA family [Streptomyces sp. DfronAA-171]
MATPLAAPTPLRVEIWTDIACPWCYVGKARFERALDGFAHRAQVEVVHRSFELDPSFPKGETVRVLSMLAKKYGMSEEQARQGEARLKENADGEGLGYVTEGRDSGNTFDMHRLLHLAKDRGRQDALIDGLYRGNFAEEESLFGDAERLVAIAVAAGLDEAETRAVLVDPEKYAADVRADEREAAELGANGVPFFVLDRRYGVSGAQPVEVFAQALQQAWDAQPRLTPVTAVAGAGEAGVCGPDGCAVPPRDGS